MGSQCAPVDDALVLRGLPALFLGRIQMKFQFQPKRSLTSLLTTKSIHIEIAIVG